MYLIDARPGAIGTGDGAAAEVTLLTGTGLPLTGGATPVGQW